MFPGDEFVPKQMQEAAALAGKGKSYRCLKVVIPSFSDTSSNVDRNTAFPQYSFIDAKDTEREVELISAVQIRHTQDIYILVQLVYFANKFTSI